MASLSYILSGPLFPGLMLGSLTEHFLQCAWGVCSLGWHLVTWWGRSVLRSLLHREWAGGPPGAGCRTLQHGQCLKGSFSPSSHPPGTHRAELGLAASSWLDQRWLWCPQIASALRGRGCHNGHTLISTACSLARNNSTVLSPFNRVATKPQRGETACPGLHNQRWGMFLLLIFPLTEKDRGGAAKGQAGIHETFPGTLNRSSRPVRTKAAQGDGTAEVTEPSLSSPIWVWLPIKEKNIDNSLQFRWRWKTAHIFPFSPLPPLPRVEPSKLNTLFSWPHSLFLTILFFYFLLISKLPAYIFYVFELLYSLPLFSYICFLF